MNNDSLTDEPFVLIGVPVYNGSNTIAETLTSLCNQNYSNFEVIVCDNSSTDNTKEIVLEFINKYPNRFHYIFNPVKGTAEGNWNYLIERMPRGAKYIGLYHADDIYEYNIISKQVSSLEKYDVNAVFTLCKVIDSIGNDISGKNIAAVKLPDEVSRYDVLDYPTLISYIMKYHNFLKTPSFFCRSEVLHSLSQLFDPAFKSSADLDMWLRFAEINKIMILKEPLFRYRISATQGSFLLKQKREELADFFTVVDKHIEKATFKVGNRDWYETYRSLDLVMCALNAVRNEHVDRAKDILKGNLHWNQLPKALKIEFGIKQFVFGKILGLMLQLNLQFLLLKIFGLKSK